MKYAVVKPDGNLCFTGSEKECKQFAEWENPNFGNKLQVRRFAHTRHAKTYDDKFIVF